MFSPGGHTRHLFGDMADTLLVGPPRSARGVSKDSLRTKIARCSRRPGRARVRRALNCRRTASPQKAESWRRANSLPAKRRPAAERKLRRHLSANLALDYIARCCYLSFSLAHEGACSRGTPEYGARRGVPRRRLVTAAPGGTGPRPPGTTTRTRGARCDRSGARRSASLGELPVREARDRSPKSPRWSAGRRASPVWDARRLVRRLACRVTCRPNGCLASTRTSLGAPPPRIRVSEATKAKPGRKKRAAGTRWAV